MPFQSLEQKREYNKLLLRNKREKKYKIYDDECVVVPRQILKMRDGSNSIFTITPIILSKNDEITLRQIHAKTFRTNL